MTNTISFRPASQYSLDWLADLYTQTFAAYFYPALITAEQLADIVRIEHIDLARSPVMFVDDVAVGLSTVGLRGDQAYCRGFGVIVPYRGRGLARLLSEEVIRQARLAGAQAILLGVLKQNERAVRTYLSSGYRIWREHVSFEWQRTILAHAPVGRPLPTAAGPPAGADNAPVGRSFPTASGGGPPDGADNAPVGRPLPTASGGGPPAGAGRLPSDMSSDGIVDANPKTLLAHHAHLHTVRPVWYRDLPSLREMPHLAGLAWPSAETPRAYVVYQTGAADHADLFDLAATQPHDAIVLLRALQTKFSRITSGNEPADSPYLPAFEATGFRVTLERYGMIKDLT